VPAAYIVDAVRTPVGRRGGALAGVHPLGATGARLMTTLVHDRRRTAGWYRLPVMCEVGGMADATVIERV
jgi:acetyl-CoA C-acetyltransferase